MTQAEPLGLISRSITNVASQTRRALTPWVQRALNVSHIAAASRATDASTPVAEVAPRLGSLGMVGRSAETFVERIQRKGSESAVWDAAPVSDRALRTDTFATGIVQRFPDISTKYQRTQAEAAAPNQQAAMPFQGTNQASSEPSAAPQIPSLMRQVRFR